MAEAGIARRLGAAGLRLFGRASRGTGWLGRHEPGLLAALLVICAAAWGAIELADEVLEGETAAVDERVLLALRSSTDLSDPIGPPWLEEAVRDFSALGGMGVLAFLVLCVTGHLLLLGARRTALVMVVAVAGGTALSQLLKSLFGRPRPDLVPHGVVVETASFPSGHSMLSAVAYLTMAVMLAGIQERRRMRIYVFAVALLLTALVGASRVYLGVHWPSDVLAGWAMGLAWALACWAAARALQIRGKIEEAPAEAQP